MPPQQYPNEIAPTCRCGCPSSARSCQWRSHRGGKTRATKAAPRATREALSALGACCKSIKRAEGKGGGGDRPTRAETVFASSTQKCTGRHPQIRLPCEAPSGKDEARHSPSEDTGRELWWRASAHWGCGKRAAGLRTAGALRERPINAISCERRTSSLAFQRTQSRMGASNCPGGE